MDRVGIATHDVARDVVGDDPVGALAGPLGGGVLDNLLGLGGEAHHQLRAVRISGEQREDVGVLGERERRRRLAFLELLRGGFGAPVADRGDHHCGVGGEGGSDGVGHFLRGLDIDPRNAGGRGERDRAGHQGHAAPRRASASAMA
jgi:hypothetical protein